MTTEEKAQALIKKLAKKCIVKPSLHLGSECPCLDQILIADVLEKIYSKAITDDNFMRFIHIWSKCGFTKSLQEVAEMKFTVMSGYQDESVSSAKPKQRLKRKAEALINFLYPLIFGE